MTEWKNKDRQKSIIFVFHVGFPKTGTTALQNIFEMHNDELTVNGVSYLSKSSELSIKNNSIQPGNSNDLFEVLSKIDDQDLFDADGILQCLEPHLKLINDGHTHCLLSAENISQLEFHQLNAVFETVKIAAKKILNRPSEIKIVYFVRDLVSHCLSFYAHDVRRFVYPADFLTYAREQYQLTMLEGAELFHSIPNVQPIALQYAPAEAMATNLLQRVGAAKAAAIPFEAGKVNKGLGAVGLALVRQFGLGVPPGGWRVDLHARKSHHELIEAFGDYVEDLDIDNGQPFASSLTKYQVQQLEEILLDRARKFNFSEKKKAFVLSGCTINLTKKSLGINKNKVISSIDFSPIQDFCLQMALGRTTVDIAQKERFEKFKFMCNLGSFKKEVYRTNCQQKNLDIDYQAEEELLISHFNQYGISKEISPFANFDFIFYKNRYHFLIEESLLEHYILHGRSGGFIGSSCSSYPEHFRHPLWETSKEDDGSNICNSRELVNFCRFVENAQWASALQFYPLISRSLICEESNAVRAYVMHSLAMFNLNYLGRSDVAAGQFREAAAELKESKYKAYDIFMKDLYWSAEFHHGIALRYSGNYSHASNVKALLQQYSQVDDGAPAWVRDRLSELE